MYVGHICALYCSLHRQADNHSVAIIHVNVYNV